MVRTLTILAAAIAAVLAPMGTSLAASSTTIHALDGGDGNLLPYSPNCNASWCYGTSWFGGALNVGSIYRVKPYGTGFQTIASFKAANGLQPSQAPAISPDGATLYGTTSQGGTAGSGVIYAANAKTGAITVLDSFTGPNGSTPQAPPIIVGDTLYGVAGQGGAKSLGVVWSLSLAGGKIKVLHDFAGGSGDTATPFGALAFNPADGMLYGMAFAQAGNGLGGIFRVNPTTGAYALVASFTPATGGIPQTGALVVGPDKALYGNGWDLGPGGDGTVFRFDPVTNVISSVFSYTPATGTQPYSGVVFSKSGAWMYSLTWLKGKYGGGTLLAIKADGSAYRILKQFSAKTGLNGSAAPTLTTNGQRLVFPQNGGAYPMGVLYSMVIPAGVR